MVACSRCGEEIEQHEPELAFKHAVEEFKKLLDDFRGVGKLNTCLCVHYNRQSVDLKYISKVKKKSKKLRFQPF